MSTQPLSTEAGLEALLEKRAQERGHDRVNGVGGAPPTQLPAEKTEIATEVHTDQTDPTQIVSDVERFIRRFVVLPENAYLPIALWVIATHLVKTFDCFPYIALLSPAKRCGKTRLQEVLELFARRPWRGTTPSTPALYRMMADAPTLILDEVEGFRGKNRSESTEQLLAILNAGHRKGATVPRCNGPNHTVKMFPVYSPKIFAAIGKLPDTLADRSIVITMQRRKKSQKVERFLMKKAGVQAKPINDGLVGFALANQGAVEQAYNRLLDSDLDFLGDRDADLWIPIFAVAMVTVPDKLDGLKKAATELSNAKAGNDADDSISLKLLSDIKAVWPEKQAPKAGPEENCETAVLLEKLKALDESPWASDIVLSPSKVAKFLRPFEVEPRGVRIGSRTPRGYVYDHLKAAFERYLENQSATHATNQ
jgi:hypothetical protein